VTRAVADRIGLDLRGAKGFEEAQRKFAREQRAGARVVGVEDRLGAVAFDRPLELLRDLRERIVPRDGLEVAIEFRASAPQWALESRRGSDLNSGLRISRSSP